MDAVREAVINAFGHRLIESGQPVEVEICRSFLEIHSPGEFPEGVTPEMFLRENRSPIHRNPLIVRTLTYSDDMQALATGFKRMQAACDGTGCKVAYFADDHGFTVRFYRHCGEGWGYLAKHTSLPETLRHVVPQLKIEGRVVIRELGINLGSWLVCIEDMTKLK